MKWMIKTTGVTPGKDEEDGENMKELGHGGKYLPQFDVDESGCTPGGPTPGGCILENKSTCTLFLERYFVKPDWSG